MQVGQNLAGSHTPSFQLCMAIDVQAEEIHYAPRSFAQRAQNLENARRFIFRMWDDAWPDGQLSWRNEKQSRERSVATNSFSPKKYEDFIIVRGNRRMGHIRVKPSGVHWSPPHGKGWFGVSLAKFAKFMEKEGSRRKK